MAISTPLSKPAHADTSYAHVADQEAGHESYAERLRLNRMGMWLFFISEAFLFGALLAARFYLWGDTRPALDQNVGLIVTTILLVLFVGGWIWAWLLTVIYAISDEWHQSFVAGRHPQATDVLIDACGAATALLAVWLVQRRAEKLAESVVRSPLSVVDKRRTTDY